MPNRALFCLFGSIFYSHWLANYPVSSITERDFYNFSLNLQPSRNAIVGSRLVLNCSANSQAALPWITQIRVRQHPVLDGTNHTLLNVTISPDGLSAYAVIENVSMELHNKVVYDCVGLHQSTDASSGNGSFADLSLHKELLVGYKPVMPNFTFYWFDRRHFTSIADPPLSEVQRRTGLPLLGIGNLTLRVWYRDSFTGPLGRNCSYSDRGKDSNSCDGGCVCNSEGHCDWGRICEMPVTNGDFMLVRAELCNSIGWCDNATWSFDRRDKEKPLPIVDLKIFYTTQQPNGTKLLSVQFRAATVPNIDQNFTYRVNIVRFSQIVASVTTNNTRVDFANTEAILLAGQQYNMSVSCRPRYFSGHESDPVSAAFSALELPPCEAPALVLAMPREGTVGAVLPSPACRNGRIRNFQINDGVSPIRSVAVDVNDVDDDRFFAWKHSYSGHQLKVAAATEAGAGPSAGAVNVTWLPDCPPEPLQEGYVDELLDIADRPGGRRLSLLWAGQTRTAGARPYFVSACELAAVSDDPKLADCKRVRALNLTLGDSVTISPGHNIRYLIGQLSNKTWPACRCYAIDADRFTGSVANPRISWKIINHRRIRLVETSCQGEAYVQEYRLRYDSSANSSLAKCVQDLPRQFLCELPDDVAKRLNGQTVILEALSGQRVLFDNNIQLPATWPTTVLIVTVVVLLSVLISFLFFCYRKRHRRDPKVQKAARDRYPEEPGNQLLIPQLGSPASEPLTEETRLTPSAGAVATNAGSQAARRSDGGGLQDNIQLVEDYTNASCGNDYVLRTIT